MLILRRNYMRIEFTLLLYFSWHVQLSRSNSTKPSLLMCPQTLSKLQSSQKSVFHIYDQNTCFILQIYSYGWINRTISISVRFITLGLQISLLNRSKSYYIISLKIHLLPFLLTELSSQKLRELFPQCECVFFLLSGNLNIYLIDNQLIYEESF